MTGLLLLCSAIGVTVAGIALLYAVGSLADLAAAEWRTWREDRAAAPYAWQRVEQLRAVVRPHDKDAA